MNAPPINSPARARRRDRLFFALRLLVGALVLALGYHFLRGLKLRELHAQLAHANLWLIALASLGNLPLVWSKARRARLLLYPTIRLPTRRLMGYFFASYAADNLLMSMAGVGLRIGLLRRDGAPLATAAAEQGLEKVLEGAGLFLLIPIATLGASLPSVLARPLELSAVAIAVLCAIAIVLRLRRGRGGSPLWLARIGRAAVALKQPSVAAETGALTLLGWATEGVMVTLTLAALHLPWSAARACLVVLAINVAALIPGLPANMGTFEWAVVLVLGQAGVTDVPALGFALVFHALHTIPVTLLGLPGLRRARFRRDADLPLATGALPSTTAEGKKP